MSPLAAAALLVYYVLSPGSRPVHGHGAGCAAACRLPAATRPESYELRLEPRTVWPAAAFNGVARIAIRARHATDVITLNAKDLDVISATVTDSRLGADVAVDRLVHRPADEQFEIRLAARVAADRAYVVTVSYGGTVRNDSTGLFAISYGEEPVTAKWLVVTDFEPTYARRVFPCYDEPVYKVVFNISVVKKKNQIALSNMPIRAIEHGPDDTETVYFESTPPMSTYLVAIYVGEFEPSKNYSKITAYTQNMYMNQTEYIGVEASKRLQVMEEYTGIEYTLPKMDMLVIPDFRAGMENWGLNIFRENYIRLQENSTTAVKMSVFKLVQHEFAHQWFGNLVTCEWWDYLWLNEGFATYFEYFATKMVCPSWPMEELFVIEIHQSALSYDQTARRSITSSVCTQDEIEDQFDVITYKKSPAVLRMLRYLVTEKLFQLSLRHYLNVNRESVAEPNDLYSSFDHVLNDNDYDLGNELTVNEFMSNWTLQPGYPVLRITKNNISNTFSVTQSRFINHEKLGETTPPAWHIGLTFTTESSKDFNYTRPCFWTNKTSTLTIIPAPENSGWFLFNIKSSGFYRVNYDVDNWMALIKQLREAPAEIHVLNRAQLIDDAFNLAGAGQLDYSVPLRLAEYLQNENNTLPWRSAMESFSNIIILKDNDRGYTSLMPQVIRLAGILSAKLKLLESNDNSLFILRRSWFAVLSKACKLLNMDYCPKKTQEKFERKKMPEKTSDVTNTVAFKVSEKASIVLPAETSDLTSARQNAH